MRSRIVRGLALFATALLTLSIAASVHATTLPLSINAGGAATGSFVADTDFSGGNTAGTTAAIDTSAVSNPAPQAVYQTERWGASTYTVTGLTPLATYTVALHFAEIYWSTTGQRKFNVAINGAQVLTNFDIVAAAGGAKKAIVKSFAATADSSGQVVITFTVGAADQPKISGIVITGATEAPYGGSPAPVPGTIQAENYDTGGQGLAYNVTAINGSGNGYRTDGVDLETTTDTGGGYDLGWTGAGQWFNYTVNVAAAGTYNLAFRVANGTSSAGTFNVQNTSGTNLTGNVTVNPTGGWQSWTTVDTTATLPAGKQVLTVYQVTGGYNINWFSLSANVPPAPTALTAAAGNTKVSLSWTGNSAATSYNVYRGTSTGGESSTPIAAGLSTASYSDTTVTNGTKYYYTVKAVNPGGTSTASNEASATPLPPAPPAPTNLGATAGNTSVSLTWTGNSAATSYDIYRGTTAGGESTTPIATGWASTTYSDTGLTNGTPYYYTVKAVNLGGTSGASNEATATPVSPTPPAPTGLSATGQNGSVALAWTGNTAATSYSVFRGTQSGDESTAPIATGITGATYTDSSVVNGVTYYYTVEALNAAGPSPASNEASATPIDSATPYGGVYGQLPGTIYAANYDTGGQGVGYSVTSVNGTADYYRPDGVDLEPCFDWPNGHDVGWSAAGQWFNYTVEVPNAGSYSVTFRVAAGGSGGSFHLRNAAGINLTGSVTVAGTGGWQNWANVTATVNLPAGVQTLTLFQDTGGFNLYYMSFAYSGTAGPTGLQASGQNQKVFLIWNAATGATSYDLYRGTVDGAEGTTPYVAGITSATYTDTNVANGTKYYYTVAAVSSTGTTGQSNESSATPTTEAPFGGTPWPIPGTIRAANYDVGGEGVAFHDLDAANDGGAYRSDGVDIESTGDLDGGYDVGWTGAGEWLNYTVNVTAGGNYTLQVRVASNGQGGQIHFNVDGVSATSEIAIPDTGGWQAWDTLSTPISISAGRHVITLVTDTNGPGGGIGNFNWFTIGPAPTFPNFGSNVFIFTPSTPASTIASTVDTIYGQEEFNQFGSSRCALAFQPGTYNVDVPVGYYTQVLGLGQLPDSTLINGYVQQIAALNNGNGTCNFWTGLENLAINPVDSGGTDLWAVSQADPIRRVHVKGGLQLAQGGASGGFLGDSLIDGQVNAWAQQQWLSRNDQWGSWVGTEWDMVFLGVVNPPSGSFPSPSYTTIAQTPVIREKPTLTVDSSGNYSVFVPALRSANQGTSWSGGTPAGTYIPISKFYIAQPGVDTASTINAALSSGLNLILTPGLYLLTAPIQVTQPNTVVLGLGIPTLEARNGTAALTVADVDGVTIAGVMIDAGTTNSPVLMQVGPTGSSADHSADPTLLSDVFFRLGGGEPGQATVSLQVNSNNVIGDDLWLWRADHGNGVGWTGNPGANGLVVNGNNVTMYGLAVEHYEQYQTLWNGNGGRTYFYQSEIPYDIPNQSSWMDGSVDGYAAYKVAGSVTSHQAYGLGIYSNFWTSGISLADAIEAPTSGSTFTDMITECFGGNGAISSIVNGTGPAVNTSSRQATLVSYP